MHDLCLRVLATLLETLITVGDQIAAYVLHSQRGPGNFYITNFSNIYDNLHLSNTSHDVGKYSKM